MFPVVHGSLKHPAQLPGMETVGSLDDKLRSFIFLGLSVILLKLSSKDLKWSVTYRKALPPFFLAGTFDLTMC